MSETRQSLSNREKFRAAGLQQRVITALVIALLFFSLVFYSSLFWFQVAMGALMLLAAWEWSALAACDAPPVRAAYAAAVALCLYLLALDIFPAMAEVRVDVLAQLMLTALSFWAVVLLLVMSYPRSVKLWSSRQVRLLAGFLTLLPCWAGLVFLKQQQLSGALVLWVVAIVALADIGAYFAGVRFGRHKLAPQVSPGKSWEGVAGGMVANLVVALLLASYWQASGAETLILVLTMLGVGAVSVLGDLYESMLKRHCGVKDSGHLLPGHGGILDRIDGWFVAVPVFVLAYLYSVVWFG